MYVTDSQSERRTYSRRSRELTIGEISVRTLTLTKSEKHTVSRALRFSYLEWWLFNIICSSFRLPGLRSTCAYSPCIVARQRNFLFHIFIYFRRIERSMALEILLVILTESGFKKEKSRLYKPVL